MKKLIIFSIAMISLGSYAQTKKIHTKSHSGDVAKLELSENGNIGEFIRRDPPKRPKTAKVDTVTKQAMIYDSVSTYKFIIDSTKTKCQPEAEKPRKTKKLKPQNK